MGEQRGAMAGCIFSMGESFTEEPDPLITGYRPQTGQRESVVWAAVSRGHASAWLPSPLEGLGVILSVLVRSVLR